MEEVRRGSSPLEITNSGVERFCLAPRVIQ